MTIAGSHSSIPKLNSATRLLHQVIVALGISVAKEHLPTLEPEELETGVEEVEKVITELMNQRGKADSANKGAFRKLCGAIGAVFKCIAPFLKSFVAVAVFGASVRSCSIFLMTDSTAQSLRSIVQRSIVTFPGFFSAILTNFRSLKSILPGKHLLQKNSRACIMKLLVSS